MQRGLKIAISRKSLFVSTFCQRIEKRSLRKASMEQVKSGLYCPPVRLFGPSHESTVLFGAVCRDSGTPAVISRPVATRNPICRRRFNRVKRLHAESWAMHQPRTGRLGAEAPTRSFDMMQKTTIITNASTPASATRPHVALLNNHFKLLPYAVRSHWTISVWGGPVETDNEPRWVDFQVLLKLVG